MVSHTGVHITVLWINTIAGSCSHWRSPIHVLPLNILSIFFGQMPNSLDIWFILQHSILLGSFSIQTLHFSPHWISRSLILSLTVSLCPIKSFNGFRLQHFVMRHTEFDFWHIRHFGHKVSVSAVCGTCVCEEMTNLINFCSCLR